MSRQQATRAARLTPEGRGAIASLAVWGPDAGRLLAELFVARGAALADLPCGRIVLGHWQPTGEELIVCRHDRQRVEIHCHGGSAAAGAILDSLAQRGCAMADWRDWIRHSVADPIAAAAHLALSAATTARTAAILADQLAGALRRAIEELAARITAGKLDEALLAVESLLDRAAVGLHLTRPWQVVLAGRPNAGKSSLINALLGFERAIVHATPGTTRDAVTAAAAIEGWPIELADTAGLREGGDAIEAAGIQLARQLLQQAELVVLVRDASIARTADKAELEADWPGALRVWNKCDLVEPDRAAGGGELWVSATRGDGLAELQQAIAARLVPQAPLPGQAVPFTPGQVAVLEELRQHLAAGQAPPARLLALAAFGPSPA